MGKKLINKSPKIRRIINYIESKNNVLEVEKYLSDKSSIEIVKNMKFNTIDKVAFEYAKNKYQNNEHGDAIDVLNKIVQKLNSDWRTCYRSFYLLSKIHKELKNITISRKYLKLCLSCNPDYPLLPKT